MPEREQWVRGAAALRAETVRSMLAAAPRSTLPTLSPRLGYELDRDHTAYFVWSERRRGGGQELFAEMERVAAAVAELGSRRAAADRGARPAAHVLGRSGRAPGGSPPGRATGCAWRSERRGTASTASASATGGAAGPAGGGAPGAGGSRLPDVSLEALMTTTSTRRAASRRGARRAGRRRRLHPPAQRHPRRLPRRGRELRPRRAAPRRPQEHGDLPGAARRGAARPPRDRAPAGAAGGAAACPPGSEPPRARPNPARALPRRGDPRAGCRRSGASSRGPRPRASPQGKHRSSTFIPSAQRPVEPLIDRPLPLGERHGESAASSPAISKARARASEATSCTNPRATRIPRA